MTEGYAGPDRGRQTRLLAGRNSCIVGFLLGVGQVILSLLGGSANTSAGILGIAFCILGYYLDARKLATATIFPCTATHEEPPLQAVGSMPVAALQDDFLKARPEGPKRADKPPAGRRAEMLTRETGP